MNVYSFAVSLFAFSCPLIGVLIRLKRQDRISQIYFLLSLATSGWAACFAIMISDHVSYQQALWAARFSGIAVAFLPLLWVHFILVFTKNENKYLNYLKFGYFLEFLIAPLFLTNLYIFEVKPIMSFLHYFQPTTFFTIYVIRYSILVSIGFFLLHRYAKKLRGRQDSYQINGLIIATTLGYSGGTLALFPVYGINIPQFGLFLMPLYPFAMAYFMTRKGLFEESEMAYAAHKNKLAAIGMLATSINHEIRNPLYVIQGLAESHLSNFEEGLYSNVDRVVQKSNEVHKKTIELSRRAMEIMKRFAFFAKAKSPLIDQCEEIDLKECVHNVLTLVKHDFEIGKIELSNLIPNQSFKALINRQDIEEVLFNLLVNARQALQGSDSARVIITAESDYEKIKLRIEDNGKGIKEEDQKKIFEPFYTTKRDGTGLGLYITKQLMERNKGKVLLKSKFGEGTIFTLEFSKK